MEYNIQDLSAQLNNSTISNDTLQYITNILQQKKIQPTLLSFILLSLEPLHNIENWMWKQLGRSSRQWIDNEYYVNLLNTLVSFNKILIEHSNIDEKTKIFLLIPNDIEVIDMIFENLKRLTEHNDSLWSLIGTWFNTISQLIYDHPDSVEIPAVKTMNKYVLCDFIMTETFKSYLIQFHQANVPQTIFTLKMLFYMKTCTLFIQVNIQSYAVYDPFNGKQILEYLVNDYFRLMIVQGEMVQSWSKKTVGCIAHISNMIARCCWWDTDITSHIKILLPNIEEAYEFAQSIIKVINYKQWHDTMTSQWNNDVTILLDSHLLLLLTSLDIEPLCSLIGPNESLRDTLNSLAETSVFDRINLGAYAILSRILTSQNVKSMKAANSTCECFLNILERASKCTSQKYKQIPVRNLLDRFLTISSNSCIQEQMANAKKLSILMELSNRYPIVYEIFWSLSFNSSIQELLRTDRVFIKELINLEKHSTDDKMKEITRGIFWNLEAHHVESSLAEKHFQVKFDLMISYSHEQKEICKQIYDELVAKGYRVWIDFDQLHGNIMDSMAHAIESSNAVIICMSEKYRSSSYCRAEAHYAFQRQLKMIPILVQKYYKPDGWLSFLIGQLLYVDFTKYEFLRAIDMLTQEINAPLPDKTIQQDIESNESFHIRGSTALTIEKSLASSDNMLDWSQSQVSQWLIDYNLRHMARLLSDYDGRCLMYFNEYLVSVNPEQMIQILQADSLRQTNELLSIVELARFRSIFEAHQQKFPSTLSEPLNLSKKEQMKNRHVMHFHCVLF